LTLTCPLGRVSGIPIRLHASFLILPALIGWAAFSATGDVQTMVWSVTSILLLFVCVLLHELGHCLTARHLGSRVIGITLYPVGGVATMHNLPERPLHEAWVAIAGPLVNVSLAALLWPLSGPESARWTWGQLPSGAADLPGSLFRANLVLVVFNLLPAFPMDGGRVLRAAFARWMGFEKATLHAARAGRFVAVLFVVAGFRFSPMLILIGALIFIAAAREADMIRQRSRWSGKRVTAVMEPAAVLAPSQTLTDALARLHTDGKTDFLICDEDRVVGILPSSNWLQALRRQPGSTPVSACMERDFVAVDESADAGQVVFDLGRGRQRVVPVLGSGRWVGILRLDAMPTQA